MENNQKFAILNMEKVHENNHAIFQLEKENQQFLKSFIDSILVYGKDFKTKFEINNRTVYCQSQTITVHSNAIEYFSSEKNKNKRYFLSPNSIIEIEFKDGVCEIEEELNLINFSKNQFTVELIFKSKRIRLRNENIKSNKFRFVYSHFNNEVTCRILTEN